MHEVQERLEELLDRHGPAALGGDEGRGDDAAVRALPEDLSGKNEFFSPASD